MYSFLVPFSCIYRVPTILKNITEHVLGCKKKQIGEKNGLKKEEV
jgi:hypothetical protein